MTIFAPHRAAIAAMLGAAVLISGCGRAPTGAPGGEGRGASTIRARIKLTPQTVLIRDGGRAVKAVSGDGATITLDARSPGAADIKPGGVVLIQDVVVVKAAEVRRDGDQLVITAEPAALTDLIQNGDIRWSNVKVDFKSGTARDHAICFLSRWLLK